MDPESLVVGCDTKVDFLASLVYKANVEIDFSYTLFSDSHRAELPLKDPFRIPAGNKFKVGTRWRICDKKSIIYYYRCSTVSY